MYFGGGFGELYFGFNKYTGGDRTFKYTTTLNGKVKFNGEFKRELDFQNFKYSYEFNKYNYDYKLIGGKVMIGTLDATQERIYWTEYSI